MQETESSAVFFVSKSLDPFRGHDSCLDCDLPVLALCLALRLFSFPWASVHRLPGAYQGVTRLGGRNIGYCFLGLRASPVALVRGYA